MHALHHCTSAKTTLQLHNTEHAYKNKAIEHSQIKRKEEEREKDGQTGFKKVKKESHANQTSS